jgi:thiosulfate reductase cytochrome b subunit
MAENHHPVPHKKFNPAQAGEGLGVIVIALLGLAMLVGLLIASGKVAL